MNRRDLLKLFGIAPAVAAAGWKVGKELKPKPRVQNGFLIDEPYTTIKGSTINNSYCTPWDINIWYVSNNGDDRNHGHTPEKALRTLQRAVDMMGNTVDTPGGAMINLLDGSTFS